MSEKKEELKKIIMEYIAGNVDPNDIKMVAKFDELLKQLELKNI